MRVASRVVSQEVSRFYEVRLLHKQYYLYCNGRYDGKWFRTEREALKYLKALEVKRDGIRGI